MQYTDSLRLGWGLVGLGLVGLGCFSLCGVDEVKSSILSTNSRHQLVFTFEAHDT